MKFLLNKNWIDLAVLFLFALAVRVIYYYFGTPLYFGSTGYQVLGDTMAWANSIQNLMESGTYTASFDRPDAEFLRPPGYSFFLGIFYLLTQNWDSAFQVAAWAQMIIDSFVVLLIYQIIWLNTLSKSAARIGGLIYCLYFFSFGWTPALYPESIATAFTVAAFYFLTLGNAEKLKSFKAWFLFASCLGIAVLMRIQLLILLPVPIGIIAWMWVKEKRIRYFKTGAAIALGFALTYGLWPARNIIFHGKPVVTQILSDDGVWGKDYMAFLEFTWGVKVDYEPQFTQLLAGADIEWPKSAELESSDLEMIREAADLMNKCGSGTQRWRHNRGLEYRTELTENCNDRIVEIWEELLTKQKRKNSFHYYVQVPFGNLYKAIFKSVLSSGATPLPVRLLFVFRTILIISGFLSFAALIKIGNSFEKLLAAIILGSVSLTYFILCFYHRNIEVRYFLQVDVLLLIGIPLILHKFRVYYLRGDSRVW